MEARVVKIQEAAKNREARLEEFEAVRDEVRQRDAIKQRAERIEAFIQKIPLRFRNKSFEEYLAESLEQIRVKNLATRYVDSFKERLAEGISLIFKGKPGTGKTLLSLMMYQELARKGFNVRYESSLEFIREMVEAKFKSHATYRSYLDALERVDFLIIDEVTESISKDGLPTEIERQVLFHVINTRYEKSLCTLVITNREHNDLIQRIGAQIVDRLLEKGLSLPFDWNSYRQRKGI